MKRIFTTCIVFFGILAFAQEAGKAGELLKNEASQSEMKTKRNDIGFRSNNSTSSGSSTSSGNRNPNINSGSGNPGFRGSQPSYNWNQNYGYSEVFVRIPEMGYFSVEIGDQMISNASGKFRFFDLGSGRMPIAIYQNGFLIYRTQLNVRNNTRLVLDFFSNYGLYLLDSYPVQGQTYGFNQWDDVWNNPYSTGNYNGNVMNSAVFGNFLNVYKNSSFDAGKIDFVRSQLRNSQFTSQQIAVLMKEMSFDKNRIEMGKILYGNCVDKQNFFLVYDTFDFDSGRKELMKYVGYR